MGATTTPSIFFSFSDQIALVALFISSLAFLWNIVRYYLEKKVSVEITVQIGELVKQSALNRGAFIGITANPNKKIENPVLMFSITNTGAQTLCVEKIYAVNKIKSNEYPFLIIPTDSLPKMIQPYETHNELSNDRDFMKKIASGDIDNVIAMDTKGGKWSISKKNLKKLTGLASSLSL